MSVWMDVALHTSSSSRRTAVVRVVIGGIGALLQDYLELLQSAWDDALTKTVSGYCHTDSQNHSGKHACCCICFTWLVLQYVLCCH